MEAVRLELQRSIRRLLVGKAHPVRDLRDPDAAGDLGLFGPASVTWRVHGDAAMLVGGIRALMLQTMHPLAMAGVANHSAYRTDPMGRLARTAAYVGSVTYGTRATANAAIRAVNHAHGPVHGVTADGRRYDANDAHLKAWVHHTLVESFLVGYQRYGEGRLSQDEADRYVAEQTVLANRLGATSPAPGDSVAGLDSWMRAIRPELKVTPEARAAVRFLLFPSLPVPIRPIYALLAGAAIGLLPGFVRRQLWLPLPTPLGDAVAVQPAARALTRVVGWALRPPFADFAGLPRPGASPAKTAKFAS